MTAYETARRWPGQADPADETRSRASPDDGSSAPDAARLTAFAPTGTTLALHHGGRQPSAIDAAQCASTGAGAG